MQTRYRVGPAKRSAWRYKSVRRSWVARRCKTCASAKSSVFAGEERGSWVANVQELTAPPPAAVPVSDRRAALYRARTMSLPLLQIDAFTDTPFSGNPAAVCVLDDKRDDSWMQRVAREMNLSETAFLLPHQDGWNLRWFTPSTEVNLCGHATLASAHMLWEEDYLPASAQARFHTRSGLLTAVRTSRGIELDFPVAAIQPSPARPDLASALGLEPVGIFVAGPNWLVETADAGVLRNLAPDYGALGRIAPGRAIVTCRSDVAPYDFLSRFFAPAVGVNEDPVTGSAHCALAPFWAERLGKQEMIGYQASPRGGVVGVTLAAERVKLRGGAITVLRGELLH